MGRMGIEQAEDALTPQAFLRELSGSQPQQYLLSRQQDNLMGRDSLCKIQVDSESYRNVSRNHAVIRWVAPTNPMAEESLGLLGRWKICDLGSVNGTFLNGQRLQGCGWLYGGDRIQLGQSGPGFVFELPTQPAAHPIPPSTQKQQNSEAALTATRLFPILSTGQDLTQKAYLIPGSITVLVVVSLFLTVGQPTQFNSLLAGYLGTACFYFVYRLCGKHKPWWLLVSVAAFTLALLNTPVLQGFIWFFREVLPGQIPPSQTQLPLPLLFSRMFLGAGLMEELIKAIPVLLLLVLGRWVTAPWQRRLGVWEPLDGILLGAASAMGFTLLETLGQYVPNVAQVTTLAVTAPEAQLAGLQLLIPRLLGSIAGHMAYSGYLGYFIGLSVLMPSHRWQILGVGYITAALLHALWNVMGSYSAVLLTVVGILSYAFLAAAILKARALSPTRSQNFATRIVEDSSQNFLP